jgi:hypothetical protein
LAIAAVVVLLLFILGCASTDAPKPLIGEIQAQTIDVATPVPCADPSKMPKRPAVHAAPVGSDAVRHMSGTKADATDLRLYADDLEAELQRCSTLPPPRTTGEKPK